MAKKSGELASQPDDENPEWTQEEVRHARPALDMIADVFGMQAAEAIKRSRGRPQKTDRKINQTLRLDADVLAHFRSQGPGWQARINQTLRHAAGLKGR